MIHLADSPSDSPSEPFQYSMVASTMTEEKPLIERPHTLVPRWSLQTASSAQKTASCVSQDINTWESSLCAVLSHFRYVQLFATPWTVAHQAPLSMGFSRQEYWSGLPRPPPRDLPDPGIKPASLMSPTLAGRFFTIGTTCKASENHLWALLFPQPYTLPLILPPNHITNQSISLHLYCLFFKLSYCQHSPKDPE